MRCVCVRLVGAALMVMAATISSARAETTIENVVAAILANAVTEAHVGKSVAGMTVLDINSTNNELNEYALLGTGFKIETCNGMILASTNFISRRDEEVTGNFILEMGEKGLQVVYQSFGKDDSLARLRNTQCSMLSFGMAQLRPTILEPGQ
jgi:hypothetical protein